MNFQDSYEWASEDYMRRAFSQERFHSFHQILKGTCDSENISIMRTTWYKFRRKGKVTGGKDKN